MTDNRPHTEHRTLNFEAFQSVCLPTEPSSAGYCGVRYIGVTVSGWVAMLHGFIEDGSQAGGELELNERLTYCALGARPPRAQAGHTL